MWLDTGGMPSSHSALVTSTMLATGLYAGFNTPVFAVALALATGYAAIWTGIFLLLAWLGFNRKNLTT